MNDYTPKLQQALAARAADFDARCIAEPTTGFAAVFEFPEGRRVTIGADTGLNSSAAVRLCKDKFFTEQFLAMAGYAVPGSLLVARGAAFTPALPCVIKPNDGMGGEGVSLVQEAGSVAPALESAFAVSQFALCQPLLSGREYRVVVLDRQVLYAYERQATQHGVSNLSKGGVALWPENLNAELLAVAVSAVDACGLRYGGVDLFSIDEPGEMRHVVLEVNPSPGFAGLLTQPTLADAVFDQIAQAFFAA